MENPNISFISTLSSHVNAKKKESIKLEEHIIVQQYNLEKINLQINKSQVLRDYVINEEQYTMEGYDWYHGLKNALKENYNIPIEDVHKFAGIINEFRNRGYDVTYILRILGDIIVKTGNKSS